MCAINGTTKNDKELVLKMNKAIEHRGPDGTSIYESDGVTLGHNRLAIIDLSNNAAQPMQSSDGRYVIVFNGEIYNYRELKKSLSGTTNWQSESDTEVLLAAYKEWKEGMFEKLRGIFTFAIWDKQEKSLLLARDQMGVKPLYYASKEGSLLFSSELSGILAGIQDPELDIEAASLYLSLQYAPSPKSLVKGVSKLRPGHTLRWQNGTSTIKRYYTPKIDTNNHATNSIYQTIDNAVNRQLISDRPVGMFLSGGLDSSIVLHHMSKHVSDVRTFSVGFEMVAGAEAEADKFNADSVLAERTAKQYGAKHKTYQIPLKDIGDSLEQIFVSGDEPIGNPTFVSQYFLSKWVRQDGIVVALGGDGGDELFGGYTRHRAFVSAQLFQKLPGFIQAGASALYPKLNKLRLSLPLDLHTELMMLDDSLVNKVLNNNQNPRELAKKILSERYRELSIDNPNQAFSLVDRETWLPDESLARSDRSSMASGVELRVPLLDLDVVSLTDQIPTRNKTWPHEGKRVLRNAYKQHLPEYLFNQPKRGWISPGAKWLRNPIINEWAKEVFSSQYYNGLDELFNWNQVQQMLLDHTEKRGYYLYPLWNILALQAWARHHGIRVK